MNNTRPYFQLCVCVIRPHVCTHTVYAHSHKNVCTHADLQIQTLSSTHTHVCMYAGMHTVTHTK